jgi:hypothetical protein
MSLFTPEKYRGVVDLGTPEQKAKLFEYRELLGASAQAPVSLAPTDPSRWKVYPKRNQDGQSSCVYHARAKMAGILREKQTGEFIEYSAADYNKRSNAPEEGSYPVEAMDFLRTKGIGLEVLEPSNELSAAELAAVKQSQFDTKVAGLSLLDAYAALPAYDFDTLISTLHATQKPMILGFFGSYSEWSRDIPTLLDPSMGLGQAAVHHELCATPNYGIYKGEEGFTIEDSWGSAGIQGLGVRWITRSFYEKRNYLAPLVPTSFKGYDDIGVDPQKPKVKLLRELQVGDTGEDVRALQSVYKYEGLFPANHPGSDYFGEITKRCTEQYQLRYGIVASPSEAGYGRVGPKTKAHINNRYK